jgi:hypothetical protein
MHERPAIPTTSRFTSARGVIAQLLCSLPAENWTWEQLANDYGADLRVDLFDDQEAAPLEILVQLKSSAPRDGRGGAEWASH